MVDYFGKRPKISQFEFPVNLGLHPHLFID